MIKQKKLIILIIFIIVLILVTLKFFDIFIGKKYGLGKPLIYEKSRILGYKIKPNQNIERRGKNININNLGMRSLNDWKDDSNYKIIFLGDSVTFGGSIVNNSDLFSEIICKKINFENSKFNCGNLGVNGYSIYSIIRSIKYKEINNEDLIIITIIANDFVRSFHNIISQPFWSKKIQGYYPAITEIFFIYFDKFRNKIKYNLGDEKIFNDINQKYYNDLVDELHDTLLKNNTPFIIFYSPSINEIKNEENNQFFKNILKNKFKNFYDLSNIKYSNKDEMYHDHIHLTKKGHEIYAEYMVKIIKEKFNN